MQFTTDMDSLELSLKLDKMEPSLVPDACVKHKNELYQKMTGDWTEVDSKGKQLGKDAADVSLAMYRPTSLTFAPFGVVVVSFVS